MYAAIAIAKLLTSRSVLAPEIFEQWSDFSYIHLKRRV